jgi:transposase
MSEAKVPRGKKRCPECSKIVGVRLQNCSCGHKFVAKKKTTSKKTGGSGRKKISADEIKWVLEIKQLVDAASAQSVSVEEFVDGVKLNPEAVLKMETLEELEALKSRMKFRDLVDAVTATEVKRIGAVIAGGTE